MNNLLEPDLLDQIIASVSAILVAIITKTSIQPAKRSLSSKALQPMLSWTIIGVAAALTFILVSTLLTWLGPKPNVAIANPLDNQLLEVKIIETGSGSFTVSGTLSNVVSDPTLRLYVLVHPVEPSAEGWWVQAPAIIDPSTDRWTSQAWIGNKEFPPHSGDRLALQVVVARPERVQGRVHIDSPQDITPVAQSGIVEAVIGALK